MEGNNNHASTLRYLFWFVRLPTPTPAIPRLIKKEKSPLVSLVTRRPTALPPPTADGAHSSRSRRRSSLAGGGGAPSSPATAALLPRRWRSLSRRPPISSEALRARPQHGQMHEHGRPWLHRVGARMAVRQVPSSPNPHLFFLRWMLDV